MWTPPKERLKRRYAVLMGKRKKGCKEVASPLKIELCRKTLAIARAVRCGPPGEALRLRWLYFPEKMRAKALAAQMRGETVELPEGVTL